MKNFVQHGDRIDIVAPSGGLVAGQFYILGALQGAVETTVLEGETTVLVRKGGFTLPKTTGAAWAIGDKLYWDAGTSKFTKDSTKTAVNAAAGAVAASGDATGMVLIGGGDNFRFASGQHTTVAASDTVVTGLAKVAGVVAVLDDDPVDGVMQVTSSIGDQAGTPAAGSILIKGWKSTDADATQVAATTFGKKVNWIAWGL